MSAPINIFQEYKDQIRRVEIERDIIRELLVDQEQYNNNIDRETAERRVNMEIFQKLQRVGAV